jgi:hypothetical protein
MNEPIAPNEATAGPKTAPNEANRAGSRMPMLTVWDIRVCSVASDFALAPFSTLT